VPTRSIYLPPLIACETYFVYLFFPTLSLLLSCKYYILKVKLTRQKQGGFVEAAPSNKLQEGKIISYVVAPFFIIYNNIYNKKGGVSIGGLRIAKSN